MHQGRLDRRGVEGVGAIGVVCMTLGRRVWQASSVAPRELTDSGIARMGVSQPRVPAVRRQTSTYRDRRWRLEDAPKACRIVLTILPPMLQRSRGVGCGLGWSRIALMASDVGGDSSRRGGDGSRVDSEVKGETQGRECLGGIEDTLFPVYNETGFSEGVYGWRVRGRGRHRGNHRRR